MRLNFGIQIEAADTERRIISGKIMEYGAVGHTSAGPVIFERGAIQIPAASKIKLLAQHNQSDPIGRAQSFSDDGDFIHGTFKISASSKGTDYLTLAAEDLISGLSVGVDVIASEPKDGHLLVKSARLIEVSLVEAPAFENAVVTKVAASAENNPPQESEAVMTTAPEETATEPVVEVPVVEASRPVVTAGYTVGEVRSPIKTHADYLQHMVAARLGNDESSDYVRAADAIGKKLLTAADNSFTTNPAFKPVQYIPGVIDATVYPDRPTIDALGGTRPLPAVGMTISHPKITTAGTAAIVGEGSSTASTQVVSSYVDATVVKIASEQISSVEVLERSGPSFYDAMFQNITKAYARAANAAVIAEIVSGGTQATQQAATIAGLQAFVAQAGPAVYAGSKEMPEAFIGGVSIWSLLIGSLASDGRPLYNALGSNVNMGGKASPKSLRGDFMGLDLWVDSGMVATTIDDCAFIGNKASIAMYESPTLTMSTNMTGDGEIKVLLYGYFAVKTLIATGLQRFDLT
jgi:HK97 family phage prohead protease